MTNHLVIIGGMGPQASLKLHELLIDRSKRFHNGASDAFPNILHSSLPVPDFIASNANFETALELIKSALEELPLTKATAIGLACNTAHLMVDRLPLSDTAFVSMIDSVVKEAKSLKVRHIGLLASPTTIKTGLYATALQEAGLDVKLPTAAELQELDSIIHRVIGGQSPGELKVRLTRIADGLERRGAQALLLGCTELPLVGIDSSLPIVDSLSALANEMLKKHYDEV